MANRDTLCDMGYEEAVVFENPDYDNAIVGVSSDGRVVYNFRFMVTHLMVEEGMTEEEAIDFIEYNTIRSLPYVEGSPIVMYDLI